MAVDINTLNALTDKFYVKKLVDNFFLGSPLLFKLRKNEMPFDGGRDIRVPISYKKSDNAGAWGGGVDTLPTNFVDHATQAVFAICYYYASITIPWTDQILNGGEAKIVDLLRAQTQMVEASLRDTMGTDIYSDGSNNSAGKKRIDGLQAVITHNADPSAGAYGGISRASSTGSKSSYTNNAWWNGNAQAANAGAITRWKGAFNTGAVTTLSLALMRTAVSLGTNGNDKPDLIVLHQSKWDAYHNLLTSQVRQDVNNLELGKQGFQSLDFAGIEVVPDDLINDAGYMYVLNTEHLMLRPHSKANFATTEFRQPPNQLVNIKYITWIGNLVCDKPQAQTVVTGLTG